MKLRQEQTVKHTLESILDEMEEKLVKMQTEEYQLNTEDYDLNKDLFNLLRLIDKARDKKGVKEMNYVFYFFGLSLFISGVGIVADTDSDILLFVGSASIVLGLGTLYVGGKADD